MAKLLTLWLIALLASCAGGGQQQQVQEVTDEEAVNGEDQSAEGENGEDGFGDEEASADGDEDLIDEDLDTSNEDGFEDQFAEDAPEQAAEENANADENFPDLGDVPEEDNADVTQALAEASENIEPGGDLDDQPFVEEMEKATLSEMTEESAKLWWVGYNYQERKATIQIEIVTMGTPNYDLFHEYNLLQQPELVVRLYNTTMRHKLARDLNATEFRTPVVYVRNRYNAIKRYVDVVLTLREEIKPKLFAHMGNLLLTFPVGERYYGNSEIGSAPLARAEPLENGLNIGPKILAGSQKPLSSRIPDAAKEAFAGAPDDGGVPVNIKDLPPRSQPAATPEEEAAEAAQQEQNAGNEENFDNFLEPQNQGNNNENENEDENNNNSDDNNENNNSNDNNNNDDNDNDDNDDNDDNNYNNDNNTAFHSEVIAVAAIAADDDFDNFLENEDEEPFNEANPAAFDTQASDQSEPLQGEDPFQNQTAPVAGTENATIENAAFEEEVPLVDESDLLSSPEAIGQEDEVVAPDSEYRPVSIEFKGALLREVIRTLAAENKTNFIFPENVGNRKVFVSLEHVPWDEALQAVLETHSLGMTRLKGGVIRIDSLNTLETEKKNLEKVRKSSQLLIPTKVLVARLSYSKAKNVEGIVKSMLPSASFDKRVKVQADERTNSIVVEAIPAELEKIKALIERIDLQTPQVKIETRVVEILKKVDNFFGINWGGPIRQNAGRGLGFGNLVFPNSITSAYSVDTGARDHEKGGRFDSYFGSINNAMELDLRLRMSELSNYTRNLQNNSVIVLDNEKATIEAGQEDFFNVPTGNGESALASVKYTLMMEVTPHITADGAIQMDIKVENSSPTDARNQAASSKSLRTLETNLLRQNGETAVIGGLYTTLLRETQQGIPILGDIPILGALFSSTGYVEDKRELIIMVTPTVVNGERALRGKGLSSANTNAYDGQIGGDEELLNQNFQQNNNIQMNEESGNNGSNNNSDGNNNDSDENSNDNNDDDEGFDEDEDFEDEGQGENISTTLRPAAAAARSLT